MAQFGDETAVALTDRSGTITSGGASQVLAPANFARRGLMVQNISTTDLWISDQGNAQATKPSIWLPSGSTYEFNNNGGVPNAAITIYGATTGQAFTAREW